jgi:hypothetical protein
MMIQWLETAPILTVKDFCQRFLEKWMKDRMPMVAEHKHTCPAIMQLMDLLEGINEEAHTLSDKESFDATLRKIYSVFEILAVNNLNLSVLEDSCHFWLDSLLIFRSNEQQEMIMNALCLCMRNTACSKIFLRPKYGLVPKLSSILVEIQQELVNEVVTITRL